MKNQLLAIAPNDLETLLTEAQNAQEIADDAGIQAKLELMPNAAVLSVLLTQTAPATPACLSYAWVGEFPFGELRDVHVMVHYNPVTCVVDISHALDAISLDQLKQRYEHAHLQQETLLPQGWEHLSDQERAEWILSFTHLQNFYRMACEHNYAVISLQYEQE